ncbi:autotransporter strand-loop-strand O-heptosyltransferase [Gluconobacter cerinus]|uniref:autotransporter strand-loop-strand O-heptosyltransferase n=1 Tax=Gluconobacter cerinus TaxID=38307 RepID=UPI001B8B4D29|nr:autotransporter strand-loop-strand O-heptosyltransferase [Gluconobacter cerinus]MBS1040689.1 autotransporter strand-loop-strand O-heptosyltransferase [Gluconobacter cerinus]MBS1047278.1 autotransporter strand-loop-strand O-heptosyltransferase [Gluconobacter cerinus]
MSDVTSVSSQPAETVTPASGLPQEGASPADGNPVQKEDEKSPYLAIPSVPVVEGGQGVRFDFNDGARVMVPDIAPELGQWHVRLSDYSTGNILFDARLKGGMVSSTKKYFVPFLIDVWLEKPDGTREDILHHELSLTGRPVLVQLPVGTLGDTIAWLPAAIRLAQQTGAKVSCSVADVILPLVKEANPDITLVGHDEAQANKAFTSAFYASYNIGLFFTDTELTHQPTDFRHVGLHRTAAYILGVDPWNDNPPGITIQDGDTPPIEGPYVVIATQASTQCKYWNNPAGWQEVIGFLKSAGYRVICIDQKTFHGTGYVYNHIPHGAEDETGSRPLSERARWLKHASFFIGLSSGLAWLAHASGTPVVMISGFTHPNNEFFTPYRIINWHTCNSCWNDPRHQFDHKDFFWCPRHKGTERQFECTRLITGSQVIQTVRRVIKDRGLPLAEAATASVA